jgi:hypothetical protein
MRWKEMLFATSRRAQASRSRSGAPRSGRRPATKAVHVVQLTPRGSGCSIVFGDLPAHRETAPCSMKGLQLVVADAGTARQELLERGVEVSEITRFSDQDGGTLFGFSDPDGNTWGGVGAQGAGAQALMPVEARGRFGAGT